MLVVLTTSWSVFGQASTSAVLPATPTWVDAVTGIISITQAPGHAVPSGTVTYSVDGGATGTQPVHNGSAYLPLGVFSIGSHTLTSSYSGDNVYPASTPAPLTFNVVDRPFSFASTESVDSYDPETILGISGIALDPHDTLYISHSSGNNIRTLDALGHLVTVPITGLSNPQGLAFDSTGNLFIADHDNHRVVEYSAGGVQSALSITGLGGPTQIAIDRTHNLLYVADPDNQQVLRYDLSAGGAAVAVANGLTSLISITVDPSGNLYYSDSVLGYQRVDPSGNITPVYANVSSVGGYIGGIFADRKGFLYISDTGYDVVLRIDQQGHQTRIGDIGLTQFADDSKGRIYLNRGDRVFVISPSLGRLVDFPEQTTNNDGLILYALPQGQTAITATFAPAASIDPFGIGGCSFVERWGMCSAGVTVSSSVPGQVLGNVVATIPGGSVSTPLYGNSVGSIAAFSPGTQATSPTGATIASGVAYDQLGNYYASDATGNRVLETTGGSISTLPFSGLSHPTALAVDGLSAVYVLDSGNKRIAKLDTAGNQTAPVVAGTGNPLSTISAFTLDGASQIYFAGDNSIYFLDQVGATSLVASGLGASVALSLDPNGNLYTLQQDGSLIRIDPSGVQTTLANAGAFANPTGLAVDSSMTAYVAQSGTAAVTLVHPDLTTFSLPIPSLSDAAGIAIDGRGSILAVDSVTNQFTFVDRSHQDFNFGEVPVNTTKTFAAYLLNSGTATSVVIGVPGNNNPGDNDFHQVTTSDACLTSPATTNIPSGGSCNLSYTVSPTTIGSISGSGIVTTSDTFDRDTFSANAVGVATLAPDTTSLTLADTPVGSTSAAKVFTITNTGSAAAVVSGVTNSDTADFSETDTCSGATVAVNATCTVSVTFHPATANVTSMSTITIASNASNPSLQLSVSGHSPMATMPQAMLAPMALNFTTTAGTNPGSQTTTLSNSGTAALAISSIGFTGANAGLFSQTNNCGTSLAAGATCMITISFADNTVGSYAATLNVTDDATPATQTVVVTANVAGVPKATLSPSSLSFNTTAGSMAPSQTLTLSNPGTAPLSIASIAVSESAAGPFSQTNTCGASMAAGASCTITVTLTSTTVGNYQANLVVTDNASPTTQSTSLAGTVTSPVAALSPASLSFTVVAGSTPSAQTATLANSGTAALAISSIIIGGANAASFAQTNTCGASLAAGANCAIIVSFTGTSVGSYGASLTVTDNSASPTQTTALVGTVTAAPAPVAALTPSSLTYSATAGSTSAAQTATLTNSGAATLHISGITLTGGNASDFAIGANSCGATLAASASCSISVTFTPGSVASFTAAISVADDAAGSPQTSTLTGTGTAALVAADFTVAATPASQSVPSGSAATYTVNLASTGGSFTDAVVLTATGLPPGATVTFSPASVTPGAAGAPSTMTVQTAALQSASNRGNSRWPLSRTLTAPVFAAMLLLIPGWRARRRWQAGVGRTYLSGGGCLLVLLGLMATITGCGAGFALPQTTVTATTSNSYTITVTGTSGSVQHNTTVQITVR
jgi:sugar lactone lactonase YvrE